MTETVIDGIVIGSTLINEKDKMVRILTKNGYFSFFAKGVGKITSKNAPSITTFSKSSFTLFTSSQGNYSLKTGLLRKCYYSMNSYNEMAMFSLVEELLKSFLNETSSISFDELENYLGCMSNGEEPVTATNKFIVYLLKEEGILTAKLSRFENKQYSYLLEDLFKNNSEVILKNKNDSILLLKDLIEYIKEYFSLSLKSEDLIKLL